MRGRAIPYAPMRNAHFEKWSAGAFANYILRGEENTKKGSIRRDSFYISQGFEAKTYHRSKRDVVRGWKYHDIRWLNSRESRGNKRKKTEKFGAVHHSATTKFHRGIIPLPNDLEVWEAKILAKRIVKLLPEDCPVLITLHFGKQYEEREEDNLHFHYMISDRHDYGIGRKVEKLFDSIFDEKTPEGRPVLQDMIEDVLRQFYIERRFHVVETGTEESIRRAIDRYEEKLIELDNDSSRNKPLRKSYYIDKIIRKKVEEFDREVEEFEKYKELEIPGSVRSCREKYKNQIEDSIDKEEKINYVIDDKIKDKIDDKDTFEFKADRILEAATNTDFEADVVFSAIDKITHDKNEILYEESIKREEDEIERNAYIENERLASLGSDVLSQTARQGSGFKRPKIVSTQERVKRQYEARKKQKLQMWKENYEKQQVEIKSNAAQEYLKKTMIDAGLSEIEQKPKPIIRK